MSKDTNIGVAHLQITNVPVWATYGGQSSDETMSLKAKVHSIDDDKFQKVITLA